MINNAGKLVTKGEEKAEVLKFFASMITSLPKPLEWVDNLV